MASRIPGLVFDVENGVADASQCETVVNGAGGSRTPVPLHETESNDKGLRQSAKTGGAESGALGREMGEFEAKLRRVIDAWPDLPSTLKDHIIALIDGTE